MSFKEGTRVLIGVGPIPSAAWAWGGWAGGDRSFPAEAGRRGAAGLKFWGVTMAFRKVLDAQGLVPGTQQVLNECTFLLSLSPSLPHSGDPARRLDGGGSLAGPGPCCQTLCD